MVDEAMAKTLQGYAEGLNLRFRQMMHAKVVLGSGVLGLRVVLRFGAFRSQGFGFLIVIEPAKFVPKGREPPEPRWKACSSSWASCKPTVRAS